MTQVWKRCSNCKKDIPCGGTYHVCNVSTCNNKRTGLVFCSVDCWDAHLPIARHKNAWSEERTAPKTPAAETEPPKRRVQMGKSAPTVAKDSAPNGSPTLKSADTSEVLVVASKVKAYIKERSGMNTSGRVMDELSRHIRRICDDAIRTAAKNERKTVLDRDVP